MIKEVLNALMIGVILGLLIITVSFRCQLNEVEKVSFEQQCEIDRLQAINDTYYMRISTQQTQINELQETLNRVVTISGPDIEEIQKVVMTESKSGSLQDAVAVTQTILNRSQLWGMTGSDVVEAPGQYVNMNKQPDERVQLAFEMVYLGGCRAFEEPVTHFYNEKLASPQWAESKRLVGQIGNHKYFL